jgi:chromosome segregation ATPase
MSGDIRHFRRRLFGGFDENDVMRYIEELAGQRNKYKVTGDKLEQELKDLSYELKRLQGELDEADRRIMDVKIRSLGQAGSNISSLKESYLNIRSEMEETSRTISAELSKLSSTLTLLSSVLDKTGYRFNELETTVEREKAEIIASWQPRAEL